MTQRQDAAGGCAVAARWCALAERRLVHLTEMFETGRWRRYHSERDFLANIREAKRAVEVWQRLSAAESRRAQGIVVELPVRRRAAANSPSEPELRAAAAPVAFVAEAPEAALAITADPEQIQVPQALAPAARPAQAINLADLTRDLDDIQQRYPLLRNAL